MTLYRRFDSEPEPFVFIELGCEVGFTRKCYGYRDVLPHGLGR